jgi:hypothetical protein
MPFWDGLNVVERKRVLKQRFELQFQHLALRLQLSRESGLSPFLGQGCRTSFRKLVLQLVLKADEVAACLDCSSELKRGREPPF